MAMQVILPRRFLFALISCILFAVSTAQAQSPQHLNYQAIIRDVESSEPLRDEDVYFSFEFLQGQGGNLVYKEDFASLETNDQGLVNVRVGTGEPVEGSFETIPWASGNIWLRVVVDAGTGFRILQETPFASVPYALFAAQSESGNVDLSYNPENSELLIIQDGVSTTYNLSGLINDADADPSNESISDITFDEESSTLMIQESGQTWTLTLPQVVDGDSNPSNELQDMEVSGTILSLSGSDAEVDLSEIPGFGDDADADPTNEIQALELQGNSLNLSGSSVVIDLSPFMDNTDNQDLTLNGSVLELTNDGTPVDLSSLPGLGDDADADPLNEIQNLELSGHTLSITNNASPALIDLSPYDNSDLPFQHIFIGGPDDKATAVQVTGDLSMDNTGLIQVNGIRTVPVSSTTPTDGQVLVYDGGNNQWEPQTISSVSTPTSEYYSIDPLDFEELTDADNGIGLFSHNALKTFNADAPFAMLRNEDGISTIAAPVHLPHGSVIQSVTIYFRHSPGPALRFGLVRKSLPDYSKVNEMIVQGNSLGYMDDAAAELIPTTNNVVDNSQYTYRMLVNFGQSEFFDYLSESAVNQLVYGVVIRYTKN